MARRNVRGRIVLLLLLPVFAICISAIPLTNPVSFFHNISTSRFASQNATSPGFSFDPLDYPIVGTPLVLRITETGKPFTEVAVNRIIDRAIREVVAVINRGSGRKSLEHNKFGALTEDIELRIQSIPDRGFTYFFLGDVLAGVWQYMHQPWSSFREVVFDVILVKDGWSYIGYGRLSIFLAVAPPSQLISPSSQSTNLALNESE